MNDPVTGKPSVTVTVLVTCLGVATLKLLISGVQIGSINLSQFTGMDFAAVLGAGASVYWARRNFKVGENKQDKAE